MTRKVLARALALVLIICLALPIFAEAESYKAKVYSQTMKVYQKPSTSSKLLGTLKKGDQFTVTSTTGSWVYINWKGKTGYSQIKDIISLSHSKKGYTTKTVFVYKTASSSSAKIDKLTADYPLYIVGENGSYYLVDDVNGKFTGYVAKSAIGTSKKNPYAVSDSLKKSYSSQGSTTQCPSSVKSAQSYVAGSMGNAKFRSYIAFVGESKLGCKYVSSGPNNTSTFTNYSFVKTCMSALGYSIPGSIKSVGNVTASKRIDRSHLVIGDIVCLNCDTTDGEQVDHIGIYLGSGYFIHASATAGCVVVSSLNSSYYKNAFCWGRRVIG